MIKTTNELIPEIRDLKLKLKSCIIFKEIFD